MSQVLADTSIFIGRESGRPFDDSSMPDELAVSIVTIGELARWGARCGRRPCSRSAFDDLDGCALELNPVPVDDEVAAQWARLRVLLRDMKRHMPVNDSWTDSWIAATPITLLVPVVAQDDD